MFQFPRCPPPPTSLRGGLVPSRTRGCPIRIRLALRSRAAPQPRFAALRVLLRLLAPRHPPCTFSRLAINPLPCWCFVLKSIATRSQDKSATRIGKYEKTSDNVSHSFRAPHSADGLTREHPTTVVASTSQYAVVQVRFAMRCPCIFTGGDEMCLREPSSAFVRHPLSISRLPGSVNPVCYVFSKTSLHSRRVTMERSFRDDHSV